MKWHIDQTKVCIHNTLVCKKSSNCERYYLNGKLHNPNGPAIKEYHDNGQLAYEEYYINNLRHNPNGPAFRSWFDSGNISFESYWINGERHRTDGPAIKEWYNTGRVSSTEYWLNGYYCTKKQFDAILSK